MPVWELLSVELLTAFLGLGLLVLGLLVPKGQKRGLGYLAALGLVGIAALAFALREAQGVVWEGYIIDPFGTYFKLLFLFAAILTCVSSFEYIGRLGNGEGEYYALIILSTLGMMILASAGELITLYLGLELMTISFCILATYRRGDMKSAEAGIKYIILGALSSAILLYGLSLLYGSTGSTLIKDISLVVNSGGVTPLMVVGMIFLLGGFAFKMAAVPFHMWAPDVYEGAPTPVTAFLSVASKAAAFAAFLRVFFVALGDSHPLWAEVIVALTILSVVVGNLVAIPQKNIKRLLAYSSISQAGYLLLGIVAFSTLGVGAILYHSMLYVFANMGAFMVATVFYNADKSDEIQDYAGLARRSPLLAAVMLFSLLSLAGIPPLAGFVSKFYLFMAVIDQGYIWLAILAVLMSMVSVYYYLQVVKVMYLGDPPPGRPAIEVPLGVQIALACSLAVLFLFGIYPTPLTNYAFSSAAAFFH
ncbi:MAG: NADH-quinone oxidoreductase subunit N [Thermanaeromonas sp.]|uniref:NADH-quinone oxidoreductase subunit N n=1 Tax=Thermanaeromonas sp. TaxID=2003697 RepID=UPI00243E775F|nr:NADH-quinone oxidoreductase subunit N [Thermanaeromonas sp.]MCG0277220.1 NADH-quinone oxidoreductase subunit N [Thermanaeromonas sp.]